MPLNLPQVEATLAREEAMRDMTDRSRRDLVRHLSDWMVEDPLAVGVALNEVQDWLRAAARGATAGHGRAAALLAARGLDLLTPIEHSDGGEEELHHQQQQQEQQMNQLPLPEVIFSTPAPCAFLRMGQKFMGVQRVAHYVSRGKSEQWCVQVTLMNYDPATGFISGSMEAFNVPDSVSPVVTYWEGELIDNVNNTFYTAQSDWKATAGTDLRHWMRFKPFAPIRREVLQHKGRAPSIASTNHIFMRWKEQFFVQGGESRLTIAGFYYVAMCRSTGEVNAFYYDPTSSPDQQLKLCAVKGGEAGYAFPHHDVA